MTILPTRRGLPTLRAANPYNAIGRIVKLKSTRRRKPQKGGLFALGAMYQAASKAYKKGKQRRRGKKQRGGNVFATAAKLGYKLGKDKRYKRMGALGVTGSYNRRPAPWEV